MQQDVPIDLSSLPEVAPAPLAGYSAATASASASASAAALASSLPVLAEDAAARAHYVPITYGTVSNWLGKRGAPGEAMHRWTCYVRSPDGADLGSVISRVIFTLHPTFSVPRRGALVRRTTRASAAACARTFLARCSRSSSLAQLRAPALARSTRARTRLLPRVRGVERALPGDGAGLGCLRHWHPDCSARPRRRPAQPRAPVRRLARAAARAAAARR